MKNEILTKATKALSDLWGEDITLELKDTLGGSKRSVVYRCSVESESGLVPATVIIKCYVALENEAAEDVAIRIKKGLCAEWAGLQFLTEVSQKSITPKFYAGNIENAFIIIEDLGSAEQLDHILKGSDAERAEQSLLGLVETMAHMHGSTIGKRELFEDQQEKDFFEVVCTYRSDLWQRLNTNMGLLCERLEISMPEVVENQIKDCVSFFGAENPLSAYSHRDACPDNCLWIDNSMYLIDFEGGEFRHSFIDAMYGRMHFPTCWCVGAIPKEIYQKMELQYRETLSVYYPDIKDDRIFAESVVTACLWHMAKNIEYVFDDDKKWGLATTRQRMITRCKCFAEATVEYHHMQETGEFILDIITKLEEEWSQEGWVELEPYCAFRK